MFDYKQNKKYIMLFIKKSKDIALFITFAKNILNVLTMILDSLNSFEKYSTLYKGFDKVYNFLKKNKIYNLEPGKYQIEKDKIWCIIWEGEGKGTEDIPHMEVHNSFIDIQVLLEGAETFGMKDRMLCDDKMFNEYNKEKDICFTNEKPDNFINLGIGNFVIFFPKDAHAPLIGNGKIKKAIFKVAYFQELEKY